MRTLDEIAADLAERKATLETELLRVAAALEALGGPVLQLEAPASEVAPVERPTAKAPVARAPKPRKSRVQCAAVGQRNVCPCGKPTPPYSGHGYPPTYCEDCRRKRKLEQMRASPSHQKRAQEATPPETEPNPRTKAAKAARLAVLRGKLREGRNSRNADKAAELTEYRCRVCGALVSRQQRTQHLEEIHEILGTDDLEAAFERTAV